MDLTSDIKKRIDNMSYEDMLREWRHSPSGTEIFQGESGDYYKEAIDKKRKDIAGLTQSIISRRVGWARSTRRFKA